MEDKTKKKIRIGLALLIVLLAAGILMMTIPEPYRPPENVTVTPTPELLPSVEPTVVPTNNTTFSGDGGTVDDGPMDVCDPRHNAAWLYAHGCYGGGGGGGSTPPAVPRGVNIEVDGADPWISTYSGNLSNMLPYSVRYIEFPVTNIGHETAKIWKRIVVTNETGGDPVYAGLASSEPEYTECGGFTAGGYVEQCNITDHTVSELYVNEYMIADGILSEMNGTWTYLGELPVGQTMNVNQSYQLIGVTTNWAQGDVAEFDIELYAVSLDGEAP